MSQIHADADKESAKGSFGYSDWQLYKFMASYGRYYKKELFYLFLLMVGFTIATSLAPLILLTAIDRFSTSTRISFGVDIVDDMSSLLEGLFLSIFPGIPQIWLDVIIASVYFLTLNLAIYWTSRKQRYLLGEISLKVTMQIREELFAHLMELDMSYHDKNEVGRIMSRSTSDVQAIGNFIGGQVVQNLINLVTVFVAFLFMYSIDPFLSFISIGMIVPIIVLSTIAKEIVRPRRKEARRTNAVLMANLAENIAGIKVTKGLTRERVNMKIFEKLNDNRRLAQIRAVDVNTTFFPTMMFLSSLSIAVLVYFGAFQVLDGAITIGALFAFINYNKILFRPIVILGNLYEQVQDALTGAERVLALKETRTKVPFNQDAPLLARIDGHVKFEDITFEYIPGIPVYKDFNLDVPMGQVVALVGQTGAGKTTIINILSRMYEFQHGFLYIDGHDITKYNLHSYREQVAAVPQDFFLFSKSIRHNLKLGNPNATEEQMWDALDRVGLKEFVERLPKRLDTPVQERGGRLSIGQRQLIIFAAVFIADPRILILDEATSSIDVFTEIKIQRTLNSLLKGRTTFIIAHRLSTIRNADQICVIEEGHIVEKGTHSELVEERGRYYELIKNQIELAESIQ